jgi:D-sorbitol dehydrogenase (acceptor)
MSGRFAGKQICLTAAGGISQTLAAGFIAEGARVFMASADSDKAREIAAALGPQAEAITLDMDSGDSIEQAMATLAAQGGIDILVNHAASIDLCPFLDITTADFDAYFATNVKGVIFTLTACAKQMIARGQGGVIINRLGQLGANAQDHGSVLMALFNATNAALVSLTKSAALALAPHGIRVNAIAPGPIEMPLWDQLDKDYATLHPAQNLRRKIKSAIPMQRFGTTDDLTGATLFLAADEAAFITGQIINVDGGHSLV